MPLTKAYSSPRGRSHHRSRKKQKDPLLPLVNRFLVLLIFFGALALIVITFYPEWKKLKEMRFQLEVEREKLESLDKETQHREHQLYLIDHDREYLEMIARDRLDLKKPDETIFRFPEKPKTTPSPAQ
jgi:cell division protein FtsB